MNKLDAMTSGSSYSFADKMQSPQGASSVFNLSHNVTMTLPATSVGALIPVEVMEVNPGDKFDISINHLLRVMPQTVPLMSNMKVYFHAFVARNSDLWKSADVYHSKGYTGNVILKKPTLNADILYHQVGGIQHEIGSSSLLHYLYGLPIGTDVSSYFGKVSALPFLMYFKIWRDYFANRYFYQNNTQLFPYSDGDFRFDNQTSRLVSDPNCVLPQALVWHPSVNGSNSFLYRDFADDRFTSAMPQQQRGNPATLESLSPLVGYGLPKSTLGGTPQNPIQGIANETLLDPVGHNANFIGYALMELASNNVNTNVNASFPAFKNLSTGGVGNNYGLSFSPEGSSLSHSNSGHNWDSNLAPTTANKSIGFYAQTQITLNAIRQLAVNQQELEKMARTDGSYREFGLTFFGIASRNAIDHCPQYIGGTFENILFTEVVQTSSTTGNSALGSYAGHGMSANKGSLGSYQADDYGLIMILMSIVPDTLYCQGLEKQHTRLYQAEEFLPERAKLGAQAILTQELRYIGSDSEDKDVFAWQDIFDELRYIPSKVRGKIADPNDNYFKNYALHRVFRTQPFFNQNFASIKSNVDYEWLYAPSECPFIADLSLNIRAVRRLPYVAAPAQIV